ncbi:phosphatidylethanolamine-binding protein [Radiomyces spectabilis]|uniref:phosphatidylethanolamine-binding protein n=1 Tax=Radiomyces spectabilis TaxID=64574 RepID=UPI002220EB0B|nr:phosphatidylethanolamine-binding protein [Radiomyces spectabilis]KAI8374522.1 phosphatidylethanolamine-binding protein [Radiomyces spectabilis]
MHVTYSNGKSVGFGTIIRPEEAVLQPTVTFQTLSEDKAYTLMMFDADAEVPLVRHWTIANIQGRDPTPAFNSNSPIHQYTPYHGPTPPENTGYHRYIFTLFEQTQFSQVLRPVLDFPNQHRAFFNLTAFINENQLKPVAAAYMLVTHQDGYEGEYKRINSGRFKSASAST